jgi:SAM-dependent methyltransferase
MDDNHAARARSFGKQASTYERLRPDYPVAAIEAFLPEPGKRVVDVGAGTGKLTGALLDAGHSVIAVEPDPDMRATLIEHLPGVDAREGVGEALPVEDHSADAICYGQSWHWVEPVAAAREARRVLTEDGVLALVWNVPDDRQPWVKELQAITHPGGSFSKLEPVELDGFGPGRLVHAPFRQRLSPADVVALVGTQSKVATSTPEQRAAVLDAVRELVATHPDTARLDEVELAYVCVEFCYRPA